MIYALLSKIVASRIYAILWAKSLRMPGLGGGGGVNLIQAMPEFWEHLDLPPLPYVKFNLVHWFFTGPRCLWGPVYGSRPLYVRTAVLWNFADVTLADDDTNSILLMVPMLSNSLLFVLNAIYASSTSWWSKQNFRNFGGELKYKSDYKK